jgi:arabinan endo-1,5-alpha-L-arabinosidase
MPEWVTAIVPDQRGHFWAPDVIQLKDRYLLYYSVSSFGKNTSAIALASNATLDPDDDDYRWVDHGVVIQTSKEDNYNAIDPAVIKTSSGELWMAFGSYWSGIKLIRLDTETGLRSGDDTRVYALAWNEAIEAAHLFEHDGWYYLFLNWGQCCRGIRSTYNIRVGRSRTITGPYVDRNGRQLLQRGGTLLLETDGPFIGPGHANVFRNRDEFVFHCHFYDATNRGRSRLATMDLSWGSDGWPVVSETTAVTAKRGNDGR